jgi:tetratricopeptide (TPR) repeat protein
LSACWPEADPHGDRLAAARILLHETMGPQEPSLARGVAHLQDRRAHGALDAEGLYALGSGLVSRRRGNEAAEVFRELLAIDPARLDARFRLAVAYDQAHALGAAVAEYQRVIDAAPDCLEPYPLLSRLLLARGESGAARALMQRHLSLRRDVAGLTGMAAVELTDDSDSAVSLRLLDEVVEVDPHNQIVRLQRAMLWRHRGRPAEAIRELETLLKINPTNRTARDTLRDFRSMEHPASNQISP